MKHYKVTVWYGAAVMNIIRIRNTILYYTNTIYGLHICYSITHMYRESNTTFISSQTPIIIINIICLALFDVGNFSVCSGGQPWGVFSLLNTGLWWWWSALVVIVISKFHLLLICKCFQKNKNIFEMIFEIKRHKTNSEWLLRLLKKADGLKQPRWLSPGESARFKWRDVDQTC